jgi:hypothetical protein
MKKKETKHKVKTYVCVVCNKKKKTVKKVKCCGKDMLSSEHGADAM